MNKKILVTFAIVILIVGGYFIFIFPKATPGEVYFEGEPLTCYNIHLLNSGMSLGENYFFVNMANSGKSVQIDQIKESKIEYCYFTKELVNKDLLIYRIDSSNPNFDFSDGEVRKALQGDANYFIREMNYTQKAAVYESLRGFGTPIEFLFEEMFQEKEFTEYEIALDLGTKEIIVINETYDPENYLIYPEA